MFTREEATALLTANKLAAQLTDAATAQLECEHSSRHIAQTAEDTIAVTCSLEDPVSDDEMAALNDRHKWSA